jgi:hypothetical protein
MSCDFWYFQVSATKEGLAIKIKYAGQIDMQPLLTYMESGSSVDSPLEAVRALNVILRNAAACKQVHREFVVTQSCKLSFIHQTYNTHT